MRSFANYRWVLAVTIFAAIAAVYFYRPTAAWAVPTGALPTGQGGGGGTCSSGESASAPHDDCPDCAACGAPAAAAAATSTVSLGYVEHDPFHLRQYPGGNPSAGNGASSAGHSSRPGSNGGMLGAEGGGITYSVPIGICGTFFGTGREFANVVAMDMLSNPSRTGDSTEKKKDEQEDGEGEGGSNPASEAGSPPHG